MVEQINNLPTNNPEYVRHVSNIYRLIQVWLLYIV